MKRILPAALILPLLACACSLWKTPDPAIQIQLAVAQTLQALPTSTPYPTPFVFPTATPLSLTGLFCEYQFCIGHPADMAFFDISAQHDPTAPSTTSQGILTAYNANLFIQVMWQVAPESKDPQFMLDLIVDSRVDTRTGDVTPKIVGKLNVFSVPITTNATPLLPNGGAAAWICGSRAFAWKVYTPSPDQPASLLDQALQKFRCNSQ